MAAPVVETEEEKSTTVITSRTHNDDNEQKKMSSKQDVTTTTTTVPTPLPSYESVEVSERYLMAKKYLNQDKFERALETIEDGIRKNEAALLLSKEVCHDDIAFHESMAPFHYLYGTTLLYNLEENSDWQQMTTMEHNASPSSSSGAATTATATATAIAVPDNNHDENSNDPALMFKEEPPQNEASYNHNADEMEIAWENLELARSIVERMLPQCSLSPAPAPLSSDDTKGKKLRMDLAQIFLREGDLQRLNGRYEDAIHDYSSCLELRQVLLDRYDRKIADAHYNMAMTYMLRCADAEKIGPDDGTKQEDEVPPPDTRTIDRNTGVYHYVACAKCLCGIIANTCHVDPDEIVHGQAAEGTNGAAAASVASLEETRTMDPQMATVLLRKLRKKVENLSKASPTPTVDPEEGKKVEELIQLLSEIQETIDEMENSARGVREVSEMKAAAEAAVARGEIANPFQSSSSNNDGTAAAAPTTTIGFGAAAAEGKMNSLTTTSNTKTQPVVMMVKKKKRATTTPVAAPPAKKMRSE